MFKKMKEAKKLKAEEKEMRGLVDLYRGIIASEGAWMEVFMRGRDGGEKFWMELTGVKLIKAEAPGYFYTVEYEPLRLIDGWRVMFTGTVANELTTVDLEFGEELELDHTWMLNFLKGSQMTARAEAAERGEYSESTISIGDPYLRILDDVEHVVRAGPYSNGV